MKRYKSFENKKSFVTIQKIGGENSKSDLGCILSSVGDSARKSVDGMVTHSLYGDIFLKKSSDCKILRQFLLFLQKKTLKDQLCMGDLIGNN